MKAVALPASPLAEDGRYGPLIDSITACAVYMLDPSGLITSWNPDAQRIKGYESSEVLGKHFSMFYSETDQADGLPDRALETSARETTFERRGWQVRKDGSRFWAHIVINRVRKQTGELLGFYNITRDDTYRTTPSTCWTWRAWSAVGTWARNGSRDTVRTR